MQITYNASVMHLEEEPLDIGYASEKVQVQNSSGANVGVGGQNGQTQLFITVPFMDESVTQELRALASELPKGGEHEVTAALIAPSAELSDPQIEGLNFYIDAAGEFADWYGVKIADGICKGAYAKALILVSKDGALFYDEFVSDLSEAFNLENLARKVFAAQTCYTGKGCH